MHKQIFIIALITCLCSNITLAQRELKDMDSDKQAEKEKEKDENTEPWYDKISYGGNLTGGIGSNSSFFLIQPLALYRLLPRTMVGAGFTYAYWSQKYINQNGTTTTFSDNAIGLNFIVRQTIFGPVFAHAEYMPMNFTAYNRYGDEKRTWGNSLYLGGGYNSASNQRAGVYVLVLYDVLWQQDNLSDPRTFTQNFYSSPWNFRIGFMF
jgi:hypothetical protein